MRKAAFGLSVASAVAFGLAILAVLLIPSGPCVPGGILVAALVGFIGAALLVSALIVGICSLAAPRRTESPPPPLIAPDGPYRTSALPPLEPAPPTARAPWAAVAGPLGIGLGGLLFGHPFVGVGLLLVTGIVATTLGAVSRTARS